MANSCKTLDYSTEVDCCLFNCCGDKTELQNSDQNLIIFQFQKSLDPLVKLRTTYIWSIPIDRHRFNIYIYVNISYALGAFKHSSMHSNAWSEMHADIYGHLSYHLLDVTDEKNSTKYNKSHVKERLFSMKTSQASSEGVFQQVCKGQDE